MITLFYQTDIRIPNSIPYHLRHIDASDFKSVKPTFISEYSSYLNIPIRKVTKETWKGERAFYHIEIDWIDAATIWQNVFAWIDKDVVGLLRNKKKNLNLLLWFPNEGFDLSMPRFIDIIDYCLKELEIPENKVYFVFGDLNIEENYKKFLKQGYKNINVCGLNSFEITYHKECSILKKSGLHHTFVTEKQRKKALKKKNKEKLFIFKNANPREHRIFFAGELYRRCLLDKSYFSWLNRYFTPPIDDKNVVRKYCDYDNTKTKDLVTSISTFLGGSPYVIDFDKDSIGDDLNQRILIPDHFLNSYFSFVTETTYDNSESDVLFITEKIYQPIVQYHPFIVAACPGILDYLRKTGYETFPELFDESYDQERDLIKRTKKIMENIENLSSMNEKKLQKIYYSEYFQDKLKHNRDNFFKLQTKNEWNSVLEWLQN